MMMILDGDVVLKDKRKGIVISGGGAVLGTYGMYTKTIMEAPIFIGECQMDCGSIGAFTQINIHPPRTFANRNYIDCHSIGRFCSIAQGSTIGLGGHSTSFISSSTLFKFNRNAESFTPFLNYNQRNFEWEQKMAELNRQSWARPLPIIENDVWIGAHTVILNGVTIHNGSVVAAGSVVTKDVPPYAIVAGNPAKVIRYRFNDCLIERLLKVQWWDYDPIFLEGLDISNPECCIDELENIFSQGKIEKAIFPKIIFDVDKEMWNEV